MTRSSRPLFNKTTKATGIVAMGVMLSGIAIAEDAIVMDDVFVTASRAAQSISEIPQTVQVIDNEQIAEQGATGASVADILGRLVPGMGTSTQISTDFTQTIRGRDVLLLIDGVPQIENRNVSRQLNTLSPSIIDRIEVISGSSAVYGSGGAGGVINIITKKAREDGVQFTTDIGTSITGSTPEKRINKYNVGQTVTVKEGDFDLFLNANYEERYGRYDSEGNRIAPEPAQVGREDTETRNILLKGGYQLNETQDIQLSGEWFRDDMDTTHGPNYGPGAAYITSGGRMSFPTEAVDGLKLDDQPYSHRDAYSVSFNDQDTLGGSFHLLGYYRQREYKFYPFPTFLPDLPGLSALNRLVVNQSVSESEVWGSKLVFDTPVHEQVNLVWGADYEIEKGSQKAKSYDSGTFLASNGLEYSPTGRSYAYGPDVETQTLAGFLQSTYTPIDPLTLQLGLRYEKIKQDISDFTSPYESLIDYAYDDAGMPAAFAPTELEGGKVNYNSLLVNTGAIYRINPEHEVFINYSEGYELPDTARLLRNAVAEDSQLVAVTGGAYTAIDDINLDAMKVKSYELGWRGQWQSVQSSVTAFYNKSDKTVKFNSDYSVDMLEQQKRIYGLEATLDVFVTDNIVAGATYAFTEGRTKDDETGTWIDLDASEVAPEKITTYVGYVKDDYSLRLQALKIQDYEKDASINDTTGEVSTIKPIDGYLVVDLIGRFNLPVGELTAGISNLFDRDYKTVYSQWAEATYGSPSGLSAEGRTLTLGYSVTY
ncbi:TonB-dependent receptor [Hahella ganghwensis]|uniref:TonB-dependent receptor n=1 Tax=Hahella ganghwensis TaxID=286420 RepID=UPI0003A9E3E1|nr:TonB-dependent receptor [Hahella ganghwensis]